ncbi:uncharacterized protein LOC117610606 isoform X2 [Osmia lignaria lignaria]|uniref:uncharacterized protein LOC117610606 isoform X2 n=1 Tax=Osmia lignaria lignaria TaxID=1437193 RepID=UPI00402B8CC7
MENCDKDLRKASDIRQMAIIGKIHNMQWLKKNSQLSGLTKTLPDAIELTDNTVESNINEEAEERIEVASVNIVSTSPEIDQVKNISTKNLNEDNSITNKEKLHSSLEVIDLVQEEMETVWNKDVNVPSSLFPNSQSLVVQRLGEQERISMTLAESIVTVQLDQFRLNEEEGNKPNDSHNEADNEWDAVDHISNLPKSDNDIDNQASPKQCHDNNNNNAKSKSQSAQETKKNVQKTTKINTKKLNEQKIKKQPGNSLKEPSNISKQGSKSKDDLLDLCNDENKTSTSTAESKKISVAISPKFNDKYSNKVNGYNKQLIIGKGTRTKEQQVFKPHFSTFNDSGNSSKSFVEGSDDKTKCVTTKLKVSRNESDKKARELDDTKRCHKVQVTRTQSYNVQYNRTKPLIKTQQRYVKNVNKPDEATSIKSTSGFNTTASTSTENSSKKRCENQQSVMNKQISDTHSTHNILGKSIKSPIVPDSSISERSSAKSSSVPCKRNYQNLSNTKHTVERNVKDDQTHSQKFKRDSNIYRRSSSVVSAFLKDLSGQAKPEDHKKNVTDNNSSKDYKVKPISTVAKVHCESEGSKVSVHPHKTSNGASNTNKTDTIDSSTLNNVQSVKSLNSCSNNTKDPATVNVSQELQVSQVSCNKTEVQFVKTEQEDTSNNNSNNKTSTSNSDTKSVKFSDNVQEINVAHRSTPSHSDNQIHQHKINPINSFYSNLQDTSNTSNAQQMENHESVQNKSYFDNNNAQYSNTNINIQPTERDLHLLDIVQQKPEQTSHMSPQNVLPQNNGSAATIAMGNSIPYQSMPAMYLSQYNNTQNVPRKTADSTIISQNALISSTSSYNVESQNVSHNDTSNVLMHNTQTSVLPPPGFHNHPITTQHNQWNLPLPDMFLFGNVMNSPPPMNMPIQNSRHVCSTDFNNMQQTGYLQQPMFYVPPMCMQSWNPLLQYPPPLFQNPTYANCNTYPNQVLSSNNLVDSVNCPVTTSVHNNTYKHFQPVQQIENPPNFSVPVKLDNYVGNMQGCKSNNVRVKDNQMDAHMRANQYRAPVPNDYQNCSPDGQLMLPFSYGIAMDSMARNCPSNMHVHMSQKYAPHALTTANYQRMPDTCSAYQNNQDSNNRKDDVSKNDSECIPPMVSPRECMYYGVNYSRKSDNVQNSSMRSDVKPVAYNIHSVNTQHYVPQFQRNTSYQNASPKELTSRVTIGRGIRKTMDQ